MSNTMASVNDIVKTQSNSLIGNVIAELENSSNYNADSDILETVFSNKKVQDDLKRLEDYLKYYNINDTANFHEITMALRLGLRIGACYMIEDHKRNKYEYFN